ncbi:MAG: tRNA lysidine(34) synthetase TilS [Chlamydiia bacterium]|nr:tRNA lysidine(34) synthetase TilS [Chlamydiia bacterium]
MLSQIANFIHEHFVSGRPVLLGYSGGTDSKALLYALIEIGCPDLHVAHIDHGWRKESVVEALALKGEVENLGLPFHTVRLPPCEGGNQEAKARVQRHRVFLALFDQIPFQALLLAHQAGDLAETTLKRLFEGAHLANLGGMRPVAHWEKMPVWRPLLSIPKAKILSFLESRCLRPLVDATNVDPRYLRARMRAETLPWLEESFGKRISNNLITLSQRAHELRDYLDRKVASCTAVHGPWGVFYDVAQLEKIEARHLLQQECAKQEIPMTRVSLERALDACLSQLPHCPILPRLHVDRGLAFFLHKTLPEWGRGSLEVVPGIFHVGDWRVAITPSCRALPLVGWDSVWSGSFTVTAPLGSQIALPPQGGSLRHLWNARKVPAFFRRCIPVLWQNGVVIKEFLSEKSNFEEDVFFEVLFSTRSVSNSYLEH